MGDTYGKIVAALNGHVTSGLDSAMRSQADQLHPVNPDTKIGKSPLDFERPVVKPAGGYSLKLPGDK